MTFGIQSGLSIIICNSAEDAVERGFKYSRPDVLPIEIEKAVVVRGGTVEGNPTVDLVLVDENGQRYVVMLTMRLLHTLGSVAV